MRAPDARADKMQSNVMKRKQRLRAEGTLFIYRSFAMYDLFVRNLTLCLNHQLGLTQHIYRLCDIQGRIEVQL
jgi:hypothetical protein